MRRYFIHNAFFRLLAPPVYGLLIYLLILLFSNNVAQINGLFRTEEVYICIGLTYLSLETMRLLIVVLDKTQITRLLTYRIPAQFIITSCFSVGLVLICLSIYFRYSLGFSISDLQLTIFTIIFLVTGILYNILYFSNYYLQKENTTKITAEKQQREVLEMEMMEFRNDINSDLLYESLENVINLMYRDVEKAEEYIDNLASAYRYVLTNRQEELIPLEAELEAAKTMVQLLNENYYGQLRLEVTFQDSGSEVMLIPGSLPVVIESIVRNTIISRYELLIIRCYQEDDEYITIQSKLNDKLILHAESRLALSRLQKSYSLYSDKPLIQVKAYEENYIKLPIIRVSEEVPLI